MATPPPDPEVLRRLVGRMDVESVARRMRDASQELPGYREFIDSDERVLELTRWNLRLFLRSFIQGQRPTDEDLDFLRDVVRERAADGMSASVLLMPYQAGVRAGWNALLDVADANEREHLLHAVDLFFEHSSLLVRTIVEAFSDERETLASEDERRARVVLDALARDTPLTPEDRLLADRLGFDLDHTDYFPFAAALPGQPARRHAELAGRLRAEGALAASEGSRVIGVGSAAPRFEAYGLGGGLLVGQGAATPRGEIAPALEDQRRLVAIAARHGRLGTVTTADYLPELLLARSPALHDEVVERVLAPLDGHADLARTLEELVAHEFERGATAAALHVHRNTLGYRMGRIEELTGLTLDSSEGRTLAWLAVLPRDR